MSSKRQAPSTRFPDDADPTDPLVGARLRYALTAVEGRICEALAAAGFQDLNPAHFKVLRFPPPENERPIDLAERAGISKQAMNYLLAHLEEMGYVERVATAGSAARLVSLTDKGWKVAQIQRATVRAIERDWERQLGSPRFEVFYGALRELTGL